MKTRKLIRQHGWTPVDIPAKRDGEWQWKEYDTDTNIDHYQKMFNWCVKTFGAENFVSTKQHGTDANGTKRFVFRNPKHVTMFKIAWM